MMELYGNMRGKNAFLKKQIIEKCIFEKNFILTDIARDYNMSQPTVYRLIGEMVEEGYIVESGKMESTSGRKPCLYGLNPEAAYFVGIEVARKHINIAITDLVGSERYFAGDIPFEMQGNEYSCREICNIVKQHVALSGLDEEKITSYGFSFCGRVNRATGYCFSYFISEDRPITSVLSAELGKQVFVENDSRAMAYGEYMSRELTQSEKTFLFFNVSWGLGMGMIFDGKLFYGRSGFAGEIGHFAMFENNLICRCGKVGCLETEASGLALHRIITEKLGEGRSSVLSEKFSAGGDIDLNDMLTAVEKEDIVAIESCESVGAMLGKGVAGMINVFNPGLIVIGGQMVRASKYLMPAVRSTVNRLALNIVSNDTNIVISKLGDRAGAIGASYIAKGRLLGII